nr:hypothetical protein [Tanacetum cinerariifolium]
MANLDFYNKHNMVVFLKKSEGSKGFHQILDFLKSTHIKYALTANPIIYVSLIHQFWETASTSTLKDGKMKITATIDGRIKTIIDASIRRHIKLEDSDGINSLPNTEIFEQLALMGYVSDSDRLTFNKGHFSPQWRVEDLQSDLQQTKLTYGVAYTKLILREKKLEHKVKTSQHRRRARVVLSDDEDDLEGPSKQRWKIAEIDENPSISLVQDEGTSWIQEDYEIQRRTSADTEILLDQEEPTRLVEDLGSGEKGKKEISTVIPKVSTTAENLVYIRRSAENRKDKGKAIMKEDKSVQKKDAEIAKQLQEAIAKADSAHDIDWNDLVGGYKQSHFKGMSYEDIRPIFERVWDRIHAFVPMDSEIEKSGLDLQQRQFAKEVSKKKDDSSSKPVRESRKKTVAKKRIGAKLDEESAKRQKLRDVTKEEATTKYEKKKEELRLSLKIIHNDDSEVNY